MLREILVLSLVILAAGCVSQPASNAAGLAEGLGNATANENTTATSQIEGHDQAGTISVDVLVINGQNYPRTQFGKMAAHENCNKEHWHPAGKFYAIGSDTAAFDRDPQGCGYGIVGSIEEKTILITEEQARSFKGPPIAP